MTQTILNGGTFSQIKTYVGPARELIVDDSNQVLVLQDGSTPGGIRFQSQDTADAKYQLQSDELNGLVGLKPTDLGFMVRLGPGQYVFRSLGVGRALTITNPNGKLGDPVLSLANVIPFPREFQEDITFDKRVITIGGVVGNVNGNVTGGLDARGKTVQLDDASIEPSKIDGLQDILDQLNAALNSLVIPTGMIMIWSGNATQVPEGWALCDGTRGTPNLADKFLMGAITDDKVNVVGGATTHTHVSTSTVAGDHGHVIHVGDTALDVTQMPAHHHAAGVCNDSPDSMFNHGSVGANPYSARNINASDGAGTFEGITTDVGGGQTHTHSSSSENNGGHAHAISVAAQAHIPPYYAMAFVMKLAQ